MVGCGMRGVSGPYMAESYDLVLLLVLPTHVHVHVHVVQLYLLYTTAMHAPRYTTPGIGSYNYM